MELECRMGNIRVSCTVNQALALLLRQGLPKVDHRRSSTGSLIFQTDLPLSMHGYAHILHVLHDEIIHLRKHPFVNGASIAKWMDLMSVPETCIEDCRKLKPRDLDAVWELALKQKVPISTIIRMFSS